MIFNYCKKSGEKKIILKSKDNLFIHLFKSQRIQKEEILKFRNLKDNFEYNYKIEVISKKNATLNLIKKNKINLKKRKYLHLIWCMIDPKTIKETLPYLNQLGLNEITFIKCQRSQKNFNLKIEKINKILISSCEQSGRNDLMKINFFQKDLKTYLNHFKEDKEKKIWLFDFNGKNLKTLNQKTKKEIIKVVIGPEGGLTVEERTDFETLISKENIISLETDLVLKSETAGIYLTANLI